MQQFESDSSSASCSSQNCSDVELEEVVNPTQLLSMAIKKRRSVYNRKERDFRQELLHTGLIQSLCKYLGEGRARRRRRRRAKSSTAAAASVPGKQQQRRSADRKREWSDHAELANSDSESAVELAAASASQHIVSFDGASSAITQPIVQPRASAALPTDDRRRAISQPPPAKVPRSACDDSDPFGLDALFREFFGRSLSSSAGCMLSSPTPDEWTLGASFSCGPSVSAVV